MALKFVPEYYFKTFSEASAEFLASIGVKGIVLDVDNTLEPYENPLPGEHVKKWLSELKEEYDFTPENVNDVLKREVGRVFEEVLEDAGVYKCTPEGREAFRRFLATVNE